MSHYALLKKHFEKLSHLKYIQRMLMWDEAVMMPEGAGSYRAQALATYDQILQKNLNSKKMLALINKAKLEELSAWDAANLALIEKEYKLSACIPAKLVAQSSEAILLSFQAWRKCRVQNDWHQFQPYLQKTFKFIQEIANRKAQVLQVSPYEALMDKFSPGLTIKKVDDVFSNLKTKIPALRNQIIEKQKSESVVDLSGEFDIKKQSELGLLLMKSMNFDFNHGRLDTSHHPFCDGIPIDIRITTHYDKKNILGSLFGIIHETGHALYEQGMPREWVFQPVGQPQSKALHESQSLLFEYEVCHSSAFLKFLSKNMQETFGSVSAFSADNLYHLITRVKTNLIRIQADEITYPLHVILRHEIEKMLFDGQIGIQDLPSVWNDQMLKYFDISTDGNYKDGVMQDMHWSWGYFGYFPSYTFGRLIAAQMYATFIKENPDFENKLEQGEFGDLNTWLHENIYAYGSSIADDELLLKVTGESLNIDYFLEKMRARGL
jgi:carboxypeptidase Taq